MTIEQDFETVRKGVVDTATAYGAPEGTYVEMFAALARIEADWEKQDDIIGEYAARIQELEKSNELSEQVMDYTDHDECALDHSAKAYHEMEEKYEARIQELEGALREILEHPAAHLGYEAIARQALSDYDKEA